MTRTLRWTLAHMLSAAARQRGPAGSQSIRLQHGLTISLYLTPAGELHLLLWRGDVYPAESEWWTVLRHFPADWPMPDPPPAASAIHNDWRYGLTAVWQTPHLAPFGQKEKPREPQAKRRMGSH